MLDEHLLRGRGAALHAVQHHNIGARLHRERGIEIRARGADLDVDGLLPVGDLAQLLDLDLQIVGSGPVGVAAGGALVDPLGQRAHRGHAGRDLLAEQHAAAAGLGALADDDLDGVGLAQMIGVHAIAGGQDLIDQYLGRLALLLGHAAIAGGGRGADGRGTAAERLLRPARQGAKAHAGDSDGYLEVHRLLGEALAEHHVGGAALAIALERIAAHGGAEEQEIVEMRHLALGAEAADVVDARRRRTMDLGDGVLVEGGRGTRRRMHPAAFRAHQ